jgi:glutathione peroxidase
MKTGLIMSLFVIIVGVAFGQTPKTLYDFKATTIDGKEFDFSTLKGKKVLIVNTASKCGFTPQYADLQKLYETYGGDKFVIIGFPENNFMNQEPGTNDEIQNFCKVNYGVSFQMMAKVSVKGKDINPIYKWLTEKSENGVLDAPVTWNFQKFMIDENGRVVASASPKEKPDSDKIVNWIKGI